MELCGQIFSHPWGKCGSKSIAGVYYWNRRKRNLLDENQIYSTLTISGVGPGPQSYFQITNETLESFIDKHYQVIGKHSELFKNRLPFLIKLKCFQRSMEIGCHPGKEHSLRLHRMYPKRYASCTHKPKLIIALHIVDVMCGFRSRNEISSSVSEVPELAILIPYLIIDDYLATGETIYLKRMFYFLMLASRDDIKICLDVFFARMSTADSAAKAAVNYPSVKLLFDQFSYDSGVFAPLFLNEMVLYPGQSLFIPPGIVHTYRHGDILEVSTPSINWLRCGLTNEYKDVDEFLLIADFTQTKLSKLVIEPKIIDLLMMSYVPPAKEMQVDRICVPEDITYTIEEKDSCSIAMVTRGVARLDDFRTITLGTTLFILPYQKITFKVKKDITIYVIFPNAECQHIYENEKSLYK